jgi:hypothetical protein
VKLVDYAGEPRPTWDLGPLKRALSTSLAFPQRARRQNVRAYLLEALGARRISTWSNLDSFYSGETAVASQSSTKPRLSEIEQYTNHAPNRLRAAFDGCRYVPLDATWDSSGLASGTYIRGDQALLYDPAELEWLLDDYVNDAGDNPRRAFRKLDVAESTWLPRAPNPAAAYEPFARQWVQLARIVHEAMLTRPTDPEADAEAGRISRAYLKLVDELQRRYGVKMELKRDAIFALTPELER